MRKLIVIPLLLAVTACSGPPSTEAPTSPPQAPSPTEVEPPTPANPTTKPAPSATAEAAPQRTNWLLLGGDYRTHRLGTGWGNKTDVIVLVSVLETDPAKITVVQFPRNLYVPVNSMDDQWLFGVWDNEGWQGLHYYFQEVFDVPLQGIFYINMDNFITLVDDLGGDGEDKLAFLRDNENNWDRGSYDYEQRVFSVTAWLYDAVRDRFFDDPYAAMDLMLDTFGNLIESDLSNVKQYYWLAETASKILRTEKDYRWVQLEEPYIIRGDTPIMQNEQPVRGMIADTDLKEWMETCAFGNSCD